MTLGTAKLEMHAGSEPQGLTAALTARTDALGSQPVPSDVEERIAFGFADVTGCILAGRTETITGIARKSIETRRSGSRLLVGRDRTGMGEAAFVNAVAGHALDLDDMALAGHPSVVLVPAILAAADVSNAPGGRCISAYLAGYELWADLATREPDTLHEKGWHPTAVLGTLAAAASSAVVLGLDQLRISHAIGIAASCAAGLVANFGTMTKPLHAGWAARNGVEAARLAQAGVTAAADVLEARTGFLAAFSPNGRSDRKAPSLPIDQLRFRDAGLSVKRYPVCYASHRVIDGIIDLKQRVGFTSSDVIEIEATLSNVNVRILRHHQPTTVLEAKFSLEFACAAAVTEGRLSLAELSEVMVRRSDMQNLMRRVRAHQVEPDCPLEPSFATHDRVRITLADGTRLDSGDIRFAHGHARRPLSRAELRDKFMSCATGAQQSAAGRLFERLLNIPRAETVSDLTIEENVRAHA